MVRAGRMPALPGRVRRGIARFRLMRAPIVRTAGGSRSPVHGQPAPSGPRTGPRRRYRGRRGHSATRSAAPRSRAAPAPTPRSRARRGRPAGRGPATSASRISRDIATAMSSPSTASACSQVPAGRCRTKPRSFMTGPPSITGSCRAESLSAHRRPGFHAGLFEHRPEIEARRPVDDETHGSIVVVREQVRHRAHEVRIPERRHGDEKVVGQVHAHACPRLRGTMVVLPRPGREPAPESRAISRGGVRADFDDPTVRRSDERKRCPPSAAPGCARRHVMSDCAPLFRTCQWRRARNGPGREIQCSVPGSASCA